MNRNTFFLLTAALCAGTFLPAGAQVKKSTKIIKGPRVETYDIGSPYFKLEDGARSADRWMVLVAQEGASSYTRPGGEAQVSTLPFGEACYVTKRSGDYLQLVKYTPAVKFKKWGRRVANWESLEYRGWVHQSKVLSAPVALRDKDNQFYLKYLTALRGMEVLGAPDNYFAGDSLKVFAEPALMGPVRRKVAMNQPLYAYTLSEDGKFYLVGTAPQCVPDSAAQTLLGWMPVQTVQPWGEKSYVAAPPPAVGSVKLQTQNAATPLLEWQLPDASLNRFPYFPQTLYPVYGYERSAAAGGNTAAIQTTVLSNLMDYSKNRIYNVLGEPVYYDRFMQVKTAFPKLNIVLLVDGSGGNTRFTAPIMTVLQQLQMRIDSSRKFTQIHYGAAIYQGTGRRCLAEDQLPLTQDYGKLSGFFEQSMARLQSCPGGGGNAVFEGIGAATNLLAGHEDESNIVIVIGADEGGTRSYEWASIINGLSRSNARLLVYQTHSSASGAFNSFVIDAKALMTQSADNIIALRKELVVENTPVSDAYDFKLTTGDHSVFRLDYPQKSRWQGAVVFPNKFESMPLVTLNQTLDTLLDEMYTDDSFRVASLERMFDSYAGNVGTVVDARFAPLTTGGQEVLADRFYKFFRKKADVFAFPGVVVLDTAAGQKGLLLSRDELDALVFRTGKIMEPFNNPDYSRRRAARKVRKYARATVWERHVDKPMRYRKMTLGDVNGLFTGMTYSSPTVQEVPLTKFYKKSRMSDADYTAVLADMDRYYGSLKTYYNTEGFRLLPAGEKMYYWIPVEL